MVKNIQQNDIYSARREKGSLLKYRGQLLTKIDIFQAIPSKSISYHFD